MMQVLLTELERPIVQIVHIGAQADRDLPAYLASGAEAVLLVEPDADRAADLEAAVAGQPRVSVVSGPVSADPTERPFLRTSFPELDSFRAPSGLKQLFPGLRVLSREPVTPLEPVRVLQAAAGIDAAGSRLLVLETPGETLGILEALQAADLLERFDVLRLREGRESLYEGAPTLAEIGSFLTGLGFVPVPEAAPEDPDRPWLEARLSPMVPLLRRRQAEAEAENLRLAQQAETLAGELTAASEALSLAQGELADLRAELQGRVTQLEAQIADREARIASGTREQEALQAKFAEMEKKFVWRGEQIALRTGERDALQAELEKRAKEAEAQIAKQEDVVAALRAQVAERDVRIDSKTQEQQALQIKFAEMEKQFVWRGEQITLRTGERDRLQAEVEKKAAEIEALIAEQEKATAALRAEIAARDAQLATGTREQQAKFAEMEKKLSWRGEQITRLTGERDELKVELEKKARAIAGLIEERDTARSSLAGVRTDLTKQQKQAEEQVARIARLNVVRDELLKAEGQIRLLGDLLLKGEPS